MAILSRFSEFYRDLSALDEDAIERIYHKDIIFDDPITTHVGLTNVKQYFKTLLVNTESCVFMIHNIQACSKAMYESEFDEAWVPFDHVVLWTMTFCTQRLNKGKPIEVHGTSFLKIKDDRIVHHKDYYDMGQMIYEHVPFFGKVIKKLKDRLKNK